MMKTFMLTAALLFAGLVHAQTTFTFEPTYCSAEPYCEIAVPGHTVTMIDPQNYPHVYLWVDGTEYYAPLGNGLVENNLVLQSIVYPNPLSFAFVYTGQFVRLSFDLVATHHCARYCSVTYELVSGSVTIM